MDVLELKQFLIKAKSSCYASQTEGVADGRERIFNDGCKVSVYQENNYAYKDAYYGYNPYIGEEVLFCDDAFIWSMNYYGLVTQETILPKQVYDFLKIALRNVTVDMPYRGPEYIKDGDFEYKLEHNGIFEQYHGIERIFYKGQEVFIGYYHGGMIKPKVKPAVAE